MMWFFWLAGYDFTASVGTGESLRPVHLLPLAISDIIPPSDHVPTVERFAEKVKANVRFRANWADYRSLPVQLASVVQP